MASSYICESDRRLCEDVARVWVDGGGDADGIEWMWRHIRDAVKALEPDNSPVPREGYYDES